MTIPLMMLPTTLVGRRRRAKRRVMKKQSAKRRAGGHHRRGISLLEVIACTAIVAVMMVPIANVIRASARSIGRSGQATPQASARSAMRWTREAIRSGQIIDVNGRSVTFIASDGQKSAIEVRSGRLILLDDRRETVLMENVEGVRFEPIPITNPSTGVTSIVGIQMQLGVRDVATGQTFDLSTMVPLSP